MTIYKIEMKSGHATISEIASELDISLPSASKMVVKLKTFGFVNFQRYGTVTLTKKGLETGKQLAYNHKVLLEFFRIIGIQEENLYQEVGNIEGFIGSESVEKIDRFLKIIGYK